MRTEEIRSWQKQSPCAPILILFCTDFLIIFSSPQNLQHLKMHLMCLRMRLQKKRSSHYYIQILILQLSTLVTTRSNSEDGVRVLPAIYARSEEHTSELQSREN